MKNLLISIGNTNTLVALGGRKIRPIAQFPSRPQGYRLLVRSILIGLKSRIHPIGISSVVPHLNLIWQNEAKRLKLQAPKALTTSNCNRLKANALKKIQYKPKSSLGPDRLANAIGAIQLYPGRNRIIVDVGTAITIDVVDKQNRFAGGLILPSMDLCLASLAKGTSLLPQLKSSQITRAIGNTTAQCMHLGVQTMVQAGIAHAVSQLRKKLVLDRPIIITTGGGARIAQHIESLTVTFEPNLQLIGLQAWLENQNQKLGRTKC